LFYSKIISDGWANWEFKDDKPDYKTATPSGLGYCFRGCFCFFDKETGRLVQDDIGCYNPKDGGYLRAYTDLLETYEFLKDRINPDGFKSNR